MSAKKDDVQSFLDSLASGFLSGFAGAPSEQPERKKFVRKDIELRKMGDSAQPNEKAPSVKGPKNGK